MPVTMLKVSTADNEVKQSRKSRHHFSVCLSYQSYHSDVHTRPHSLTRSLLGWLVGCPNRLAAHSPIYPRTTHTVIKPTLDARPERVDHATL